MAHDPWSKSPNSTILTAPWLGNIIYEIFINNIFIDNDSNYIDNVCGMDVYRHVVLGVNYKRNSVNCQA